MKLKYVAILVAMALLGGVFLPTRCGDSKVAYWKGRSEQALKRLKSSEQLLESSEVKRKEDKQASDERIAELEEGMLKDEQKIAVVEKEITVTREMLKASGLYEGLVVELDKKWAEKYSVLEAKVTKKDEKILELLGQIESYEEALNWYVSTILDEREATANLQKLCSVQETQLKKLRVGGKIWKWAAIAGGGYIGYTIAKELL